MISTGCVVFTMLLSSAARPQPAATERMDSDAPQVIRCIMEVLTQTLAEPRHPAVSQRCLEVLSSDETITSILHHQNLLRELQEVAVQGGASDKTPHSLLSDQKAEHNLMTEEPGSQPGANTTADMPMLAMLGASGQQTVEMTGMTQGEANGLGWQGPEGEAESEEDSKEEHWGRRPPAENASMHSGKEVDQDKNPLNLSEEKEHNAEVNTGTEAGPALQEAEKSSAQGEEGQGEQWAGEREGGKSEKMKNKDLHPMNMELQSRAVAKEETEEGSASSRSEDREIERLAAIESELGKLAWRLHELWRG